MLIHSSAWPPAFQFSGHQLTKKYIWVVSYSRLLEAGGFTRSQDFLIDQSPETTLNPSRKTHVLHFPEPLSTKVTIRENGSSLLDNSIL
ncbi:hypothetical protein ABKN59_004403 [Abortiporus biennis]